MTTKTIDVREMDPQLLDLIAQVVAGAEIILTDGHTLRARLVPVIEPKMQRVPGLHLGGMTISADFDEPLPEDVWPGTT